jgi:hypothetical protein
MKKLQLGFDSKRKSVCGDKVEKHVAEESTGSMCGVLCLDLEL